MTPEHLQTAVGAVTRALRDREDELVARMLERFADEAPEAAIAEDPDMAAAMRLSCHANLRSGLGRMARGDDGSPIVLPTDAIEEARTSAHVGVPLAVLLQTYRIGQAVGWDGILDAVASIDGLDPRQRTETLRICTRRLFEYVDAVTVAVSDEYARERSRLDRSRDRRRGQLVRELLGGGDVDDVGLGYDPNGPHRALVAWGTGDEDAVAALARRLDAPLLRIAANHRTTWGWLATRADDRTVAAHTRDWAGGVAFGRRAEGPDGFRESHREARAAHRIGAATSAPVTFFDDVALESLLLADETAARAFASAELAPLDAARDGAKLRQTLLAYFAAGFNAAAAAASLDVNDRTIAYRLHSIEELLGRPVRARHAELQAALRIERVLAAGDRDG